MHHPRDRIAFVTPVVEHWLEREVAQWVCPTKDRSDDPSHHERTLLPRSYISLPYKMTSVDRETKLGVYLGLYQVCIVLCELLLAGGRDEDITFLVQEVLCVGVGTGEPYDRSVLL